MTKFFSTIGTVLFISIITSTASAAETKHEAPEMICAKKTTVVVVNGKEAYRVQSICVPAK